VAQKAKDAIVDQLREKFNERPSVDLKNPDLRINIHINEHMVSVAIDSSGDSLHKRGYRKATNAAPINEVLAAGLVILSGWDGQCDFMDPMCGSGTILIEAAMIAHGIPPNLHRQNFAFKQWRDWDPSLFKTITESLTKKNKPFSFSISGFDIDADVIQKAKENIKSAGVEKYIQVKQADFFESVKPNEGPLHILFNPPYDERIDIDTEKFYTAIGSTLKKNYPGTNAWLVTANMEALKFVGLKTSRRIEVANGQLDARLVKYEMYEGTRRTSFKPKE
jgi:putative N6-adenine-specific DNA methylase